MARSNYHLFITIYLLPLITSNLSVYFWLPWLFVVMHGLSLVVVSGGYSVAAHRPLVVVASPVVEHGF